MNPAPRKFITNQRSVPKQSRASYQFVTTNDRQFNQTYYAQYNTKKQLTKNSSQLDLKHPKQEYFKNLNQRRKNEGQMSNLKSQLQNLKNEVSKLISKQPVNRTPQKQRPPIRYQNSDQKVNYVNKAFHDEYTDRQDDFDDTSSMNSVTTQKVLNQPLRRLQKKANTQNFDQSYYMQLENDLLKTEIKNLKNKYVSKKRQLTQKVDLLQKKNEYFEVNLQKSEQSLAQCRKALQMQIMMIKKQISQKSQINNAMEPQTDKIQIQGNDVLKDKVKRLYQQLTDKSKQINNQAVEIGDLDSVIQRKKFQLKKQLQKNLQLSKQIQLSKREQSRLQQYIQTQMSKRKDLIKQNESLKQKNKQLMNQLYTKQQIVSGSQQYENRLSQELQLYKKREDQLQVKVALLRQENHKFKQLIQSDQDEINYLKKNNDDTLMKISQLNRKLKDQQQKMFQKEDIFRKTLDDNKKKQDQRMRIFKEQFQSQTLNLNQEIVRKQENQNIQILDILRQKDRQINRWKAQYKILKLKHEQKNTSDKLKKDEIDEYYKGYFQNKNKNELLQESNKLLQKSVDKYLKIINVKETQFMKFNLQHNQQIQDLNAIILKAQRQFQSVNEELLQVKNQLTQAIHRANDQEKYRHQIDNKISFFVHKQLHGEQSDGQQIENQQSNQFNIKSQHFSSQQNIQLPSERNLSQKIIKQQKKVSQSEIKLFELSQSQRIQLEQLSETITIMKKRLIQQQQKGSKNLRQLKNKDTQILKLKKQIRQLLETHERQLSQIKQRYYQDKIQLKIKTNFQSERQIKQLCLKQVQIQKQKYGQILSQNVQMKRKIIKIQKQLSDIKQQAKSLSHLYNIKCLQSEQFFQRYTQQNNQRQRKIQDLQIVKNQREINLINQINILKDQIASLRYEIRNLGLLNKKIQTGNFDQALRNQIQSNKVIRQELMKKNQEIYKVRDNYTLLRSNFDNLRSQNQIQKLKNLSQRKNLQVQYQIQQQNLKNKLSVQQKKISSLQQKIALVIEQNKKKDSFIQSYIMGKKLPQNEKQFTCEFIKQYQIQLNGQQINDKLQADSHQLEKITLYNYNLLKQLAEMKEKMLLYESTEGQNLSLYDSRISIRSINQQQSRQLQKQLSSNSQSPTKRFQKTVSLIDSQEYID